MRANDAVGFKLMDTGDMAEMVDLILETNPTATAEREDGGYYELDGTGELVVDLDAISGRLDEPVAVEDFLRYVSSYYGRISVEGRSIRLSADMLGLDDYERLAAGRSPSR